MAKINTEELAKDHSFSDEEIVEIIKENLPQWGKACDAAEEASSAIILHQKAFGRSVEEMLLLGCAIKYAEMKNVKEVTVIS